MSEFHVIFLEEPVVGKPVKIRHDNTENYTAEVTHIQDHPRQKGVFRVWTASGAICVGPCQPEETTENRTLKMQKSDDASESYDGCWKIIQTIGVIGILVYLACSWYSDHNKPSKDPEVIREHAIYSAQGFVRDNLLCPSTAKFATDNVVTYVDGHDYYVSGFVEAENAFGAPIKSPYAVRMTYGGKTDWDFRIQYLEINGETIIE